MQIHGVKLLGLDLQTGEKVLLTVALLAIVYLLRALAGTAIRFVLRGRQPQTIRFWTRQGLNLSAALLTILGLLSIWFNDAGRLATGLGLVTAGVAFSLQRVITALAGYFIILNGKNFTVGDRIAMGGVRGDVIALGFIQTTLMEMGQAPGEQGTEAPGWVHSRQYTGRVVTVANDKIFADPVYNYTRDFPYLWEELAIPIPYQADRARAEQVLLEAVRRHTVGIEDLSRAALEVMRRRYFVQSAELEPQVYYRLTDNWLELSVRFVVEERSVRAVKDRISRDILAGFEAASIEIASATVAIVQLPSLRWQADGAPPR